MARRTDLEKLRDHLASLDTQRAMPARLAADMHWGPDKLDRVLEKAAADPSTCIARGKGGVIEYTGNEIGAVPLLYREVTRVLESYWAKHHKFRDVRMYKTAHGGRRGMADWVHPDAVIEAYPAKKSSPKSTHDLHSFEIERAGGFKIESIFQAFVQGRGSDYSWVVFSNTDIARPEYLDRVLWAAGYVDVGLISYGKPGSWTTWTTHLPAKRRGSSKKERDEFCNEVLGDIERAMARDQHRPGALTGTRLRALPFVRRARLPR